MQWDTREPAGAVLHGESLAERCHVALAGDGVSINGRELVSKHFLAM